MLWNSVELPDNPYYQDDDNLIYCADCREILPLIPDKSIDLVLTDPPYGVGLDYLSYDDTRENWQMLMDFIIPISQRKAIMTIMPSGGIDKLPYIYHNHPPLWLVCWYKGSTGHLSKIGFNEWEALLVYGKPQGLQMHDYFQTHTRPANNGHPCPKPDGWALWLISKTTQVGQIILDPFLGSGTTAYCAKKLGRKCIGVEIEEKYCEIATKRCSQTVMKLNIS